jgi:hypothetical protein
MLRWNGLLSEVCALRHLGFAEIGGWDGGIDIRTAGGTAQIKFRSASHYGISRPQGISRMKADYILLAVPGCSYLDRLRLGPQDEICLAGWMPVSVFYEQAQVKTFFGKPHLFMDQPLNPMPSFPLSRV